MEIHEEYDNNMVFISDETAKLWQEAPDSAIKCAMSIIKETIIENEKKLNRIGGF